MLDERRLRTFAMVAQTGSIARAAEKLAFTPPAVSQQLAALERQVGAGLLERHSRGVELTEAGRALLGLATDVLDRLDLTEATMRHLDRARLGPLRVAAFGSAGWTLLPRAFTTLRERHPRLRMSLTEAEPPEALDLLKTGAVDVAVTYSYDGVPEPPVPAVELTPIVRDPLLVVVPRDHPVADRPAADLADFANEPWIAGAPDAVCSRATLHACHAAGFEPRVELNLGDFTTVCGMVGAGFGVALVPTLAMAAGPPGVRGVPLRGDGIARHIWAVNRPHPAESESSLWTDTVEVLRAAVTASR